jgi:hypothetical protein
MILYGFNRIAQSPAFWLRKRSLVKTPQNKTFLPIIGGESICRWYTHRSIREHSMNAVSPNNLIRSNIFLPVAAKKALQARAKKLGVSYSTLIRRAIAAFLGSADEPFEFKTAK